MRLLGLLALTSVAGGCREAQPHDPNCATRPADFRSFTEPPRSGAAAPIEPPFINRVELRRGGAPRWNDVPLGGTTGADGWATLGRYLTLAGSLDPQGVVTLTFARGTSCADVERARTLIRRSLACGPVGHCFQGAPPR